MLRHVRALAVLLIVIAAPAAAQTTHVAIVVGLAGDPEHAELFQRWAATLVDASVKMGVTPDHLVYLAEKPEADPKRIGGKSTKEEVAKAFDKMAQAGADDVVFVFLIGHGTFDGQVAKFNLPGPDMTPEDFEPLLKRLKSQHVVLVNTSSASGPFVEALAAPGRDDRRRDAERRRAVRDALRRLLRRRARRDRGGHRQERPHVGARGVQLRQAGGRRRLRARGDHADRAPDPQRQRRQGRDPDAGGRRQAGPGGGGDHDGLGVGGRAAAGRPEAAGALCRAARPRAADRRAQAAEGQHGRGEYASELERLATELALKTRQIRESEGKRP